MADRGAMTTWASPHCVRLVTFAPRLLNAAVRDRHLAPILNPHCSVWQENLLERRRIWCGDRGR